MQAATLKRFCPAWSNQNIQTWRPEISNAIPWAHTSTELAEFCVPETPQRLLNHSNQWREKLSEIV
jgi:hypothetical protein